MLYLIGGAPRAGKSILCQQFAAKRGLGWVSTDMLADLLRFHQVPGVSTSWDASPEAIRRNAEWFYPSLERFAFGAQSTAESYVIEGVGFLPDQVVRLGQRFALKAVFLGCTQMNLERFDRFPGRSRGYAGLPEEMRRQFAEDVPSWSEFIRQEAERWSRAYVDMSMDFEERLLEAEKFLIG
jgi:hypothetical protein